jgi:hypothetical protein
VPLFIILNVVPSVLAGMMVAGQRMSVLVFEKVHEPLPVVVKVKCGFAYVSTVQKQIDL